MIVYLHGRQVFCIRLADTERLSAFLYFTGKQRFKFGSGCGIPTGLSQLAF